MIRSDADPDAAKEEPGKDSLGLKGKGRAATPEQTGACMRSALPFGEREK